MGVLVAAVPLISRAVNFLVKIKEVDYFMWSKFRIQSFIHEGSGTAV
jgi:hypothetical protein